MKTPPTSALFRFVTSISTALLLLQTASSPIQAAPATLLFEDNFTGDIPGWTLVQPAAGAWVDGPMLWQFDKVSNSFRENSNIHTGGTAGSATRLAVMLINETVAPANFGYTARLTAGDDDGFGLIWGYENEATFYRIAFSWQANRTAVWPALGVTVDRMSNNVPTDIVAATTAFIGTVNRPFDLSIGVTNGLLTVDVTDDPLGSSGGPLLINIATDVALPTSAAGRVGMFSWGQQGNNPAAFRIQSPALNGTSLDTAVINSVLTNDWSFTITPSTANDYPNDTGTWGFGKDINGPLGMMIENNDSAPENTIASSTNTPVNAAVIGDLNWSNYVVSARFITPDDDGFGLMLRYQDRTNWYRIGFRRQNSLMGVKQGISVQKNVNRTFDQMFHDQGFVTPINAAFDVHAAVRDNFLQIMCVLNPDSTSPTVSNFGPIDMSASTLVTDNLATGKAGVFSWAQRSATTLDYGTGVDSFRVRKVENEGLLVSSPFGTPDPPTGLNDFPVSGSVTARVDSLVISAPGVRQVSLGWSGAGSVPATGNTNEAIFTLTQFSLINWKWQTQYELITNTTAGGTITSTLGPWVNAGSNVTVTASANPGNVFVGWSGDSIAVSPVLSFPMVRPVTLTAHFAVDSDNDQLPDSWEFQYFGAGNLSEGAGGNPDLDGADNITEYRQGSNPAFAEALVLSDGLLSSWINESYDRALPGWFVVTNFGNGFRGLWENSNQNRAANSAGPNDGPFISATSYGTNASFQGPLLVVRSNIWNPAWAATFSLSAEYSVGDNDGLCLYFRYLNASNWYRVTICGDDAAAPTRPVQYLSIQKRTNGWFTAVTPTTESGAFIYNDELDLSSFKRIRITVNATNDTFEVRAIGWNALLAIPDWDPNFEKVVTFTDADVPSGRIAIGPWGMGGGKVPWSATNGNPVGAGLFIDNLVLQVAGTNAFVENWETAPLHTEIPAGWGNPYAGVAGYEGDWNISAHGTFANFTRAFGTDQTGTLENPKADAEGPILLAPVLTNASYLLELGIHPLDDGGIGFVYDFKDTNNFARVLFDSQAPLPGDLAQGVNVSRKSGGVWTDIAAGDAAFVYTPGRKFDVRFANNNGVYTLSAWNADAPATVYRWQWNDQASAETNRLGLAIWDMPDGHFTYARAYSLPQITPVIPFRISSISVAGGNVTLNISRPDGSTYHVLRATSVTGPYTTNAASQTGTQYSEPLPSGATHYYRLQLLP